LGWTIGIPQKIREHPVFVDASLSLPDEVSLELREQKGLDAFPDHHLQLEANLPESFKNPIKIRSMIKKIYRHSIPD